MLINKIHKNEAKITNETFELYKDGEKYYLRLDFDYENDFGIYKGHLVARLKLFQENSENNYIGNPVCGQIMDNPFQESKQYNSLQEETCSGCEHLAYNSDGSVECLLEYEHKCRPETRVMYKKSR